MGVCQMGESEAPQVHRRITALWLQEVRAGQANGGDPQQEETESVVWYGDSRLV